MAPFPRRATEIPPKAVVREFFYINLKKLIKYFLIPTLVCVVIILVACGQSICKPQKFKSKNLRFILFRCRLLAFIDMRLIKFSLFLEVGIDFTLARFERLIHKNHLPSMVSTSKYDTKLSAKF